jgi:hypothetical protein
VGNGRSEEGGNVDKLMDASTYFETPKLRRAKVTREPAQRMYRVALPRRNR